MDIDALIHRLSQCDSSIEEAVTHLASSEPEWEPLIARLSSHLHHEAAQTARWQAGAFYTPTQLAHFMVDQTLPHHFPCLKTAIPDVLDPTCGTGRLLLQAGERLVKHHGGNAQKAWQLIGPHLHGFDTDPLAIAWLRGRLISLAGGDVHAAAHIRHINALAPDALPSMKVDVILGNPPFGSPLRSSHGAAEVRRMGAQMLGIPLGPYIDQSTVFLALASQSLRPGGHLAMVQPLSMLASRDAESIRTLLSKSMHFQSAWASQVFVFDAQVHACVLVLNASLCTHDVARFGGLPPQTFSRCAPPTPSTWASLAAPALGVPDLPPIQTSGTIGDHAHATADFRDQYYGLAPALESCTRDIPEGAAPILTTGLIDPAHSHWEHRPTRLHKKVWQRPVIHLERLDDPMQRWAQLRLVPKVILPTQTRALEPFLDLDGRWLPCVPLISITAPTPILPGIAALLASPITALIAMNRHLGTARTPDTIKLSAKAVLELPWPADQDAMQTAGIKFRDAQHASTDSARFESLQEIAFLMMDAFSIKGPDRDTLFSWWHDRLPETSDVFSVCRTSDHRHPQVQAKYNHSRSDNDQGLP